MAKFQMPMDNDADDMPGAAPAPMPTKGMPKGKPMSMKPASKGKPMKKASGRGK